MDWIDWARMLAALGATLALIGLAAYAARRFGVLQANAGQPTRRLRVVESLMLDPRRRLVVVRFEAREHVLLLSPAGDCVVSSETASSETSEAST